MALGAGSIAFTGFNSDGNDNIAFLAAEALEAGTTIYFTDNEWTGTAFNTGESSFSWTASDAVAAGTVIRIDTVNGNPTTNIGSVSYVDGTNKGLSNGGEIVYAYTGTATVPTAFLAAVASDGFTADSATLAGTGLAVGSTALEFTGGIDIAGYTGPRSGLASYAAYVAALNTAANFTTQNAGGDQSIDGITPDAPFPTDGFTLGGAPGESQRVGFAADGLTVSQAEGDAGQSLLTFTLVRTGGATGALTVNGSFAAGTTDAADFGGAAPAGFTATIADGAASTTVSIAVSGDTVAETDERFGLTLATVSGAAGVDAGIDSARAAATGIIVNDDAGAPLGGTVLLAEAASLAGSATTPVATDSLRLVRLGSIEGSGAQAAGRAESIAFDAATKNIFTSNLAQGVVDITALSASGTLSAVASIDLKTLAGYGAVNSVAVANGILAVAYEAPVAANNGHVALFDAATGTLAKLIEVGNLPDELTFSPDGTKILVANEGQAITPTNNPAGSVSIIDVSGGAANAVVANTIGFGFLTGGEALLKAGGLSLFPGQAAGTDVEPEYISVSPDGTRAYVTLQEVNAVAVIDLTDPAADRPLSILPLGSIDRTLPGNAFDASDRDGISLENFDVRSLLQPDAIASFAVAGTTYFVTANEGDARVGGLTDEVRLGASSYVLDPAAYPDAAALKANTALGRLNVLTNIGDTDGDGDFDQIYTFGGRGISIFRQNADGTIEKVRETGGEFESFLSTKYPSIFNIDSGGTTADDRSDNKGPEPEGVAVGQVGDRLYAFVTLERQGGVMVYDISDPARASLTNYIPATAQDSAPEVVTFVSAADSPTGVALVLSANEVSGTITAYAATTRAGGDEYRALVDDAFYLATNPDVAASGAYPENHYATVGRFEGRDPNAFFDTSDYLAANADVARAGVDPVLHYLVFGANEGRDPSALFDGEQYLARNPDVAAAGVDPLVHYLTYGQAEGRAIYAAVGATLIDDFDPEYYLLTNPDVAAAGVDPFQHYLVFGAAEGRDPNAYFDTSYYLAQNPDVAAAGVNPLEHYEVFGWKEGRDPSADFDTSDYLAAYADVAASGMDPLEHYLLYGRLEGRDTFADDPAPMAIDLLV
ncbi:choice-of-anchor I family protein [Sphingomonas profundi]|uniref:choice-of-anchor I family protein n=1 Tax=Alterirhizorhabdus profundi TaxID=2681549 RepID=UPI0012E8841D|nr:choice-of-anchor I family protein [Sphingomonas profundi]